MNMQFVCVMYTFWSSNMAMGNSPFIDDVPISMAIYGDGPASHVSLPEIISQLSSLLLSILITVNHH